MSSPIELPELPARIPELVDYIADNPEKPMAEIMDPYRKYESNLRAVFAQDRQDPRLDNPYVNVLPLFTDKTDRILTRARDLAAEPQEEKDRYIMALPDDKRRPHDSPATVGSIKEFQKNFGTFSENSLADLNWDNVVAAGSSVVNCLLPVPPAFNTTKRKLREYYHEKFCPASDVDLFLYGLDEEQAIEKIKEIERAIRDTILSEVTVVRTKYAITIASSYPTRHVQIVLRSYKSISEILTGFDIDSAGGAYDGDQVYVTPRALGSFITQINQIDLSRRSPSYENRLSKYSHRNFEVYWPELDRKKVDPTIFERSFGRTLGLARLLVLERLPTSNAREAYLNKRRQERGRPTVYSSRLHLWGNIKDSHEDEVADWVDETEVSNYHTFTVPYGQHFHAKKIEKLCYTRDLLLNAEWNQNKHREVYLHRHPAFFGRVEDVVKDCCGYCPVPVTPEEIEVAEKEAEIYISGKVKLLIDDPGRQQIGSFNPLTADDWTDMAYVGNTARLCQSIVDSDVDEVLAWMSQSDADINQRDYTGRSPLQLAVMCSTPDVVKCIVDHGARLTARMADGKTALHLAAERGIPEIVKLIMEKSIENEEAEEEKQDQKRRLIRESHKGESLPKPTSDDEEEDEVDGDDDDDDEEESDIDVVEDENSDDGAQSFATGSFVKVKKEEKKDITMEFEAPDESEPDFYKIDVLAWDIPTSPLHLAIARGNESVVKLLCEFGGDALLPVKLLDSDRDPVGAILTLTLAASLPLEDAKSMAKLLLGMGASSAQADMNGYTVFHQYVESARVQMVDILLEHDQLGVKTAINHLVMSRNYWDVSVAPLHAAVAGGDLSLVLKLLNAGAQMEVDFETWLKAAKVSSLSTRLGSFEENKKLFDRERTHPLIKALHDTTDPDLALTLLQRGADPNSMTRETYTLIHNSYRANGQLVLAYPRTRGQTALDLVRANLAYLRAYKGPHRTAKPALTPGMDGCLAGYMEGTYKRWTVSKAITTAKKAHDEAMANYEKESCGTLLTDDKVGTAQMAAVKEAITGFQKLEKELVSSGAKTFAEIHPDIVKINPGSYAPQDTPGNVQKAEVAKPYEYVFQFSRVTDLTQARRDAYVQLFEAAWAGDLEKIKSLTLRAWDEDQVEPPLKITAVDGDGNSPFSLAFFLGHYDVAWAVAEIAHAQYSPGDEEKKLYQLEMGRGNIDCDYSEEDSEAESDSDSDGDYQPRVVSKVIDKKFTIDNIGEVSMQVKSRTKPLEFIEWPCNAFETKGGVPDPETYLRGSPWNFFMRHDRDGRRLKRFLDLCIHFGGKRYEAVPGTEHTSFTLLEGTFRDFVETGKVKILREVIKRTGAGIPVDHLVKKSGVEMKDKPRFYQGLSVYGKKRKDWATAGRNMYVKPTGLNTPPILHVAAKGRREAVEWFLSDEPLKLYMEFSQSKAASEDSRYSHLATVPGGFESVVSKWLGNRNELVLHSAVMAPETEEAVGLVKYLIESFPASLEAKDDDNNTPLLNAAFFGRAEYLKILIGAGADQSVRNKSGENVIHRALVYAPNASVLKKILDPLDKNLRTHLLKQKTTLEAGGRTPTHFVIENIPKFATLQISYRPRSPRTSRSYKEIVELLLEYSRGIELEMLDSAGNSPLHTAVMESIPWLTKVLAGFRPKLLFRENAVGRTPAEVARDKYTAEAFAAPNRYRSHNRTYTNGDQYIQAVLSKTKPLVKKKYARSVQGVWELCCDTMGQYPDRRRLVSLPEANDVALRLGDQYSSSRYFSVQVKRDNGDDTEETDQAEEAKDFVWEWMKMMMEAVPRTEADAVKAKASKTVGESCGTCGHRHSLNKDEDDEEGSDSE